VKLLPPLAHLRHRAFLRKKSVEGLLPLQLSKPKAYPPCHRRQVRTGPAHGQAEDPHTFYPDLPTDDNAQTTHTIATDSLTPTSSNGRLNSFAYTSHTAAI